MCPSHWDALPEFTSSPHRNNLITVKATPLIPSFKSANFCLLNVRSLAVKHWNDFNGSQVLLGCFSTFESPSCILKNKLPILCVLIYRPFKLISGIIQEFSDLLSVIMLQYDRVLILGGFNVHVCCPSSSSFSSDIMKLLNSFSLTQNVKQPSYDKGHTLDLVLANGFCVDEVNLVDFAVSDHKAVLKTLWNSLSIPCFCQACMSSLNRWTTWPHRTWTCQWF